MKQVFLGLGSNLGKREENLDTALHLIGEEIGADLILSSVYETEPWMFDSDSRFLNMVVRLATDLGPHELLGLLLGIEKKMGRIRKMAQYSSRVIDIDILFYEDLVMTAPDLKIPHPHIHERRFVLVPLVEIAPDFIHPVFHKTVKELLNACIDNSAVRILK